jgi:hypothetical protein
MSNDFETYESKCDNKNHESQSNMYLPDDNVVRLESDLRHHAGQRGTNLPNPLPSGHTKVGGLAESQLPTVVSRDSYVTSSSTSKAKLHIDKLKTKPFIIKNEKLDKGLNSWGRSLIEDARIVQESYDEIWSSNIQVHMVRERMPDHLKDWMYSNSFLFYNMNISETINRVLTYLTASLSTSQILRTLLTTTKETRRILQPIFSSFH